MRSLMGPGSQNDPTPFADLVARLGQMRAELNDATSSVLKSAGIAVATAMTTFDRVVKVVGGLIVEGDAEFSGDTTVGGTMLVTGDATFQGDLAVPNGSITNDALANPISPGFGFDDGAGYAMPLAGGKVTRAQFDLVVPAGYTQALISASAQDAALNSTAGFDYLVSYVKISTGPYAYAQSATVPPGHSGASFAAITELVTGLTDGQVISVVSQPYVTFAPWAANSSNSTILSGTCLFLR